MIASPHGALFVALFNTTSYLSSIIKDFPTAGACIGFMIGETILYFGLAFLIDRHSISSLHEQLDHTFNDAVLNNLDDDVKAERDKTLLPEAKLSNPLTVSRLRKVFPSKRVGGKPVVATEDVAFSVQNGEIFGLLGANGAGKSTTLSMLTRHLIPTSGNAFIGGYSVLTDFPKASKNLGVVTQNNSLWDLLTVEDHLFLFARLRGVPENVVGSIVSVTIDQLELTPHRKKLAAKLSGGMKRKLCVAIALIGDPGVVLLDEPSAGLDPVSRRNLWTVILRTMSHRSVVLTTHSMEEAEALCNRIGIMVKGQICALGSKQHLKSKFASGYELVVKLRVYDFVKQVDRLTQFINSHFPSAELIGENGGLLTYRIPQEEMKMGVAFTQIESLKGELDIEDYSVAQPSLEQVFIRTVVNNTPADAKAINPLRCSLALSGPGIEGGDIFLDSNEEEGKLVAETNSCGCTKNFMRGMIAFFFLLLILFWSIAIFGVKGNRGGPPNRTGATLNLLGVLCLITSIIFCCVHCCPCCQKPKDADQ